MEHVQVQGASVPALGLGTWRLTGPTCQQAVEDALAIGYRHIDTAQMYGNEAEVGAGIGAAGVDEHELFVTTKIDTSNHEPAAVSASVAESLDKLGLDAVDLLLIHQPEHLDILEETLSAMQQLVDEGRVRHLGVSNFSPGLLERAVRAADLFAIQVEYHPFRSQDEQLDAARQNDLLFQAYSPLARGGVVDDDEVVSAARSVDATPAQVALRWLIDQSAVAAIPKASSRAHLEENWGALDVELDEEARRRLDAASRRERDAAEVGS